MSVTHCLTTLFFAGGKICKTEVGRMGVIEFSNMYIICFVI
jgi:hypothetical protein